MAGRRTREELEGLSRKEIQQLAMDANLKANQKTVNLIEQLVKLSGIRCDSPKAAEKLRTPLKDISSSENKHTADRKVQERPALAANCDEEDQLSRQLASCSLATGSPERPEQSDDLGGELAQQLAACSLSAADESSTSPRQSTASSVCAVSGDGADVDTEPWEDQEGEMETIRDTLAQLLALGFSADEAQVLKVCVSRGSRPSCQTSFALSALK